MNLSAPKPDPDEVRLRAVLRGLPMPEVPATLGVAVRSRIAAVTRRRRVLRIGASCALAAVVSIWVGTRSPPGTAPSPAAFDRAEIAEWFAPPPIARFEVLARQEAAWSAVLETQEDVR